MVVKNHDQNIVRVLVQAFRMKKDIIEITFKDFFENYESEVESFVWFKIKNAIQKF